MSCGVSGGGASDELWWAAGEGSQDPGASVAGGPVARGVVRSSTRRHRIGPCGGTIGRGCGDVVRRHATP
eukprot:4721914-Prymnesium_polylepis.1